MNMGQLGKELVREKDMPYMTFEWKNATRKKRKYAMIFSKNRTQKPQEPHFKKYHNLATKERRKAVKAYWSRKSEELYKKQLYFYKTFAFLNDNAKDVSEANLRILTIELLHHVNKLMEELCNNHPSVENIWRKFSNINFDFSKLENMEVQAELKNLNSILDRIRCYHRSCFI